MRNGLSHVILSARPLACHSERSEESLVSHHNSRLLQILRCAQNDMAKPLFHGVLL